MIPELHPALLELHPALLAEVRVEKAILMVGPKAQGLKYTQQHLFTRNPKGAETMGRGNVPSIMPYLHKLTGPPQTQLRQAYKLARKETVTIVSCMFHSVRKNLAKFRYDELV